MFTYLCILTHTLCIQLLAIARPIIQLLFVLRHLRHMRTDPPDDVTGAVREPVSGSVGRGPDAYICRGMYVYTMYYIRQNKH